MASIDHVAYAIHDDLSAGAPERPTPFVFDTELPSLRSVMPMVLTRSLRASPVFFFFFLVSPCCRYAFTVTMAKHVAVCPACFLFAFIT